MHKATGESVMSQTKQEKNKALVLEAFDTLFNKRDHVAAGLLKGLGFAVIDLGSLRGGGRAQQVGNGLAGVDLIQIGD
jgi:hypothetical protein